MNIIIEGVVEATPEVHDLIGELNDVLGAAYDAHQRHGLPIEQLFEPNVRFFLARLENLAVGCGGVALFDDYAEVKRHVYPASGTPSGSCEGSAAQDRRRGSWSGQVGLAPRNGHLPAGGGWSRQTHGVSATRAVRPVCGNAAWRHRDRASFSRRRFCSQPQESCAALGVGMCRMSSRLILSYSA